ncbi:hypothetical protein BZARG_369 [Bizionia argentinensis JUB59]|uniref:General secretion pathway protein n=1 Tax=Bizionia argentinensis JUB59 TaxID=1046627 RepID=G2EGY2_9FLAO|nr:hypothetical protein [Bizionia argentinensis]EGV42270.2 hypothetical protein BZARG_369 [Bizionia argentinensis JUB59]
MTSRNKNITLIIGFIILLFVCFKMAISKSIDLVHEHNSLKIQELLFNNTPKELSLLKQKHKYYDSLFNKYQLNGSSIQNNLLKSINATAEENNIKIISFLEPHIALQNDLTIKTYKFVIEGDYNHIIQLIHQLEQKSKYGEIINLHFEKKKNFRTGNSFLEASVLLRSFG